METRYTVQEVRGVAMGGGMFQVVDGYQGRPVGEPTNWKDEAEKTANRLNNEEYWANQDDSSAYEERIR